MCPTECLNREDAMELSCRMLFSQLAERFSVLAQGKGDFERRVSEAEFFVRCNELRKECVYIVGDADDTSALSVFPAVFCGFVPAEKEGSWIAFDADAGHILNAVLSIFGKYEKWEERLKSAVLKHGTIEAVLDIFSELANRPVFLLNRYFVVKASSKTELMPLAEQVFTDEEDPELISALMHDRVYKENLPFGLPYYMPAKVLPFNSVNINLGKESRGYGMLCVVEEKGAAWKDTAELLSVLAIYVDYLSSLEENEGHLMAGPASVLHGMISDMNSDYEEATGRLDAYGWSDEDDYLCACFLTEGGKTPVGTPESICRKLNGTYPGSCAFVMEDRIICFFNLSKTCRENEVFYNEITLIIREYYLRTGYSRQVRGKRHMRRQYIQAEYALEKGISAAPHRWIFHFDEFAPEFMKERVLRSWPPQMLVHHGLETLMKSDSEGGTEYMNTLKAMLDCGMSATAAAEKLYIHRSTLLYRMDKIRTILGSRLDSPDELTYLSVSFYLLGK